MEKDNNKWDLDVSPEKAIFTLSVRNYITHYQIRKGSFLLAIVILAMLFGLILLRLPTRAAFVASGILIYSILLAVYPYLGLFGQIWLYFRPVVFWGGPQFLRPVFLVTLLTMTFFLVNFVFIKKTKLKFPQECKLMLLLLVCMVLSSFFAVHSTSESFSQNVVFLKIFIFYVLIINLVTSKKELNALVWFIIMCCTSVSLQAIRLYRYYGFDRVDKVGGVHRGANFLAAILVLTLPLVFQKINSKNIYEKVISIGLMPIFIAAVFLTGSRGGTLGLVAILVLLVWRFRRRGRSALVLALLVLATALATPSHYWTRAKTIVSYQEEVTAQSRIDLWKGGLQMYGDHPLTGVGQGNFVWISPQYTRRYSKTWTGEGFVAHNTFIQLLAEGGIQTLLAFLVFVAWTFRRLWAVRRKLPPSPNRAELQDLSLAVEIGLIGFLVCGISMNLAQVDVFYWLLAIGPILSTLAKTKPEKLTDIPESGASEQSAIVEPVDSS